MKRILQLRFLAPHLIRLLLLTGIIASATAQEVSIPDAALKSAIWRTLGKSGPVGIITEQDMLSLTELDANSRGVKSLEGLGAARNLTTLHLGNNRLTEFSFLSGLTSLTYLDLSGNQLTSVTLPAGLKSLTTLDLYNNQLTSLTLPPDLTSLTELRLGGNQLSDFSFLSGLTSLTYLDLGSNQLTSLTLPAGLVSLTYLGLDGNPLWRLILPKPLADEGLAVLVAQLKARGLSIFTYPLIVNLVAGQRTRTGTFVSLLTGPPGVYRIEVTPDLSTWTSLEPSVNNVNGSVTVVDPSAPSHSRGFYRAILSK